MIWAAVYNGNSRQGNLRAKDRESVTPGLKCAPEMPPREMIKAIRVEAVDTVLTKSIKAELSGASRWPMMPDPIMAAARNAVPVHSVINLRARE
jgi:hypothetical protein